MNSTVHGGTRICRLVAKNLGGRVLEPTDDFLATLPLVYVNRRIDLMTLETARSIHEPKFIKPVNDKHFPAAIYRSGADLAMNVSLDEELVLVAESVEWDMEFRMFVLDYQVRTYSLYKLRDSIVVTQEQFEQACAFCQKVLADKRVQLPRAVVLDVGLIHGRGWSVVEANPAVMSHIYNCDPAAVLEVLEYGLTQKVNSASFVLGQNNASML